MDLFLVNSHHQVTPFFFPCPETLIMMQFFTQNTSVIICVQVNSAWRRINQNNKLVIHFLSHVQNIFPREKHGRSIVINISHFVIFNGVDHSALETLSRRVRNVNFLNETISNILPPSSYVPRVIYCLKLWNIWGRITGRREPSSWLTDRHRWRTPKLQFERNSCRASVNWQEEKKLCHYVLWNERECNCKLLTVTISLISRTI